MGSYLLTVLAFGLAAGTFATTVSQSVLFKPMRVWVAARNEWLGELIGCPYCLSHWAALGVYAVIDPTTIPWYVVTWLATVGVAALVSGMITRLHGGE